MSIILYSKHCRNQSVSVNKEYGEGDLISNKTRKASSGKECLMTSYTSYACQHGEEDFKIRLLGKGNLGSFCSYQFDANATNKCLEPGQGLQVSRRAPEGQHKGIPDTPASKSSSLGAKFKCLCANTTAWGISERR